MRKEMEERIKLTEKLLAEGKEYLNRGDPIQASEKLYKTVEEGIKLLAEQHGLPEYKEAVEEGRWWSRLLVKASGRLARDLGKREIEEAWAIAFNIHVWGFHECGLGVEDVKEAVPYVEWLVNYLRNRR